MDKTKSKNILNIESKPKILNYLYIGFAEFFGTAILLFLSCTGNTLGIQGEISSMHLSLNSGLAVMAVIQIFGHISGAHVNPVVTLSALILNEITLVQAPIYIICQILGSLTGCAFQMLLTPNEYVDVAGHGVCVTAPHEGVSNWQAFGIETILTVILIFSICASWDHRNSDKMDSVSIRIGLVVGVLNLAAGAYTGASMNPARSFGPAVWTGDYTVHWVYWVGPTTGSLLATYFYKYLFLRGHKQHLDALTIDS